MADFIVDPATAMQSKYTKIDMPFKFSDKSEARTSYRRRLLVEDGDVTPLAVIPREDSVFGKVDREFDGEIDAEILGVPSGGRVLEMHSQLQKVSDDLNDMVEDLLEEREKDFFLAYRTHMFTVQRELTSLKNLSDSNETKGRRVQKVRSLEAELQWFTAEALRSSDTLQEGELRERYDQVVEDFNRSIRTEKAAINRLRDDTRDEMRGSNNVQPGAVDGLVDIFTRCVDEVKGRIVERRNDSAKEHAKTKSESAKSRVEPRDVGLGWLTAGDRKHILETFLLDKKVLQLLLDEAPSSKESGVL